MPNISFFKTREQIENKTKFVTRRNGWLNLVVGDILTAVYKSQGLKKGEKIEKLALIRVVSVRREPLEAITQADVILEGFPDKHAEWFITLYLSMYKKMSRSDLVTRIEFQYIESFPKLVDDVTQMRLEL